MKTYVVAELTVTDPSWVGDYLRAVTPLVKAAGGRYLARTPRLERLEGERSVPNTAVILEFPSRDAALAFYHSDAYQPWKAARLRGSNGDFLLVAGEDVGDPQPR